MIEQNFLDKEIQEPEQKFVFISEPNPCPASGLRGLHDETTNKCTLLSPAEDDLKQNLTHLPPDKNKERHILDTSEQLITSENDFEELSVNRSHCSLQTSVQISHFHIDNSASLSQLKQKSDSELNPANHLKEKHLHSVCGQDSDHMEMKDPHEYLRIDVKAQPQVPEESKGCDIKNIGDLPSGKIQRKVKILLGRNKIPRVELAKKRTEFIAREGSIIGSSPVQSLLDIFQTSEEKSEFLGFTSYTENSGICDVLDIWEEENSDKLLSMFFSSPSTSTFTGF